MAEFNVTYNINSDEMIRNVDDTFRRITEMSRNNSAEQIRLMNEQYSSMTSILDSYMDRVRIQFSTYIDIAKNTWAMASSDTKDYFDETMKKMDELLNASKSSYDKQTEYSKEATKQKLNDNIQETDSRLESLKKQADAESELAEKRRKLNKITGEIDSGISGISEMGGLGSTTGGILKMGGDLIGGALNIATGLNAGQGIKDIAGVLTQGIGMLIATVKETDDMKRNIILSHGGRGIDTTDIYGGDLDSNNKNSLLNRLQNTQTKFAGTKELGVGAQQQLGQQYESSRQFGDIDYQQLGVETTMIGKSRNMGSSEVANLFIDIKQKLNEPLENLTGRFFQLDNISKDLGISIRDVIKDYQTLMRDNLKYGYTQEEVMGMQLAFGEQLKEGTVSASQLSQYMKGIAGMGTDQSVGLSALLREDQAGTMSKFNGDKDKAQQIFDLVNQSSDADFALIQKIINSPKADVSTDPFLSEITKKYNLTDEKRESLNPVFEQLIQAKAINQAGNEGSGVARIIEEKMMQLQGLPLSNDLFESGQQQRGWKTAGTTKGVMSLGDATNQGNDVIDNQAKLFETIKSWTEEFEQSLKQSMRNIAMSGEQEYKRVGSTLETTTDVVLKKIREEGAKTLSMFTGDKWTNHIDTFSGAVEKFDKSVEKFSSFLNWTTNNKDENKESYGAISDLLRYIMRGKDAGQGNIYYKMDQDIDRFLTNLVGGNK